MTPDPTKKHLNPNFPGLWYGGDYCPEQWPRETWDDDVRLMRESHFHVATMGMFAWSRLEPKEGQYDFQWLDEAIEKLSNGDRWFILATPSAAPPAWLSKKYPESLRTGSNGVRRGHGNRVNYSLGSPIYRQKTKEVAHLLAERYGNHPRLLAWHMSNEYCGEDFGPESIAQFREWLKRKFKGDLDALNHAYWSAFWGHTFRDWDEIDPPGEPYGETAMQGLTVDWMRFVTDQTVDFMLNEAEPLRRISPHVPVTTNLMGTYPGLDYRKFAEHIDFVSWDSYPSSVDRLDNSETWFNVGFRHDLMRSLKPDIPWLLMEYTPSSANWYNIMQLKRPGIHRFESMHALAHGADGLQYFQWRQSRGGQEQFHGGVVGHCGTNDTRVFREVQEVGERLESLGYLAGSTIQSEIAVVFDWENRWALDAACGPTRLDKKYEATCIAHYRALRQAGYPVDIIGMDDDLSRYRMVVAPMAYSLRQGLAERIEAFVSSGGAFVTTYLSGWVDENSLVFSEGFLSPLRKVLGVRSEEIDGLHPDQANAVRVAEDTKWCLAGTFAAVDFCELVHLETAEALGTFGEDFYAGWPALTVNAYGDGFAFYVASRNGADFHSAFLPQVARELGLSTAIHGDLPVGVTTLVRSGRESEFVFLLNATSDEVHVDTVEFGLVDVPARDVVILTRECPDGDAP